VNLPRLQFLANYQTCCDKGIEMELVFSALILITKRNM